VHSLAKNSLDKHYKDKFMFKIVHHFNFAWIGLMILSSCSHLGPNAVQRSRTDYNVAIEQTNSEQLLLNLVRLRYRDIPFFMETASISTSFSFGTGFNASAAILPSVADSYGIAPHFNYSETPTITYTPLQGDKFVERMLTPLNLQALVLLYHSGWSIDRLMRVAVQYINGIPNAPTASGPTPEIAPEYQEFNTVSALIRRLQLQKIITLAASDKGEEFLLSIKPDYQQNEDVQTLLKMLKLDRKTQQFPMIASIGYDDKHIAIVPRSLMASMFYLSQAVETPESDRESGKVTLTQKQSGEMFDWQNMTKNLFRIRTTPSKPDSAYVAINYRGVWFYIDDSDLTSKSTFSLLTQLLALQSGHSKSIAPILTIPVTP